MTLRLKSSSLLGLLLLGLVLVLEVEVEAFVTAPPRTTTTTTTSTSTTSLHANEHDAQGDGINSNINRRRIFVTSVATTALVTALFSPPPAAFAKSGDSASMKVPGIGSYIDFLIEKNKEQQGGTDASAILYKSADLETQLRRLSDAANRLTEVRDLAQDRKWSQVQGIITGPLGTLLQTMNTVVSASGGGKEVKDAAGKVKGDVIAIGQAATKKSVEGCIAAADMAMNDLEGFVKIAFE